MRGKVRIEFAESLDYGTLSNSELAYCIEQESATVRKVLSRNPEKGACG